MSREHDGMSVLIGMANKNQTFSNVLLPYLEKYIQDFSLIYYLQMGGGTHNRCDIQYPKVGKRTTQKGKEDFLIPLDKCVQCHVSLSNEEEFFGFVLDIDNHTSISKEDFLKAFRELILNLRIKPTFICTSPSQKGIHAYFMLEKPLPKEMMEDFLDFMEESIIDGQTLIRLNFLARTCKDKKLRTNQSNMFGFEILDKVSTFINEEAYLKEFGTIKKEKKMLSKQGDKVDVKYVPITQEQISSICKELEITDTQAKNVVLKNVKELLAKNNLLDGVQIRDMDFDGDEHNGFVQVKRGNTGVFLVVYSNRVKDFVANYFCKMSKKEVQEAITGNSFTLFFDALEGFVKKKEISLILDGEHSIYCNKTSNVFTEYEDVGRWVQISDLTLNNLWLDVKRSARDMGLVCEMSLSEFRASLMALASKNMHSLFIEKMNKYAKNYEEKVKSNPSYNPIQQIANYWPNKDVRLMVEAVLRFALSGAVYQYTFGQSVMKKCFIGELGLDKLIPHTIGKDAKIKRQSYTIPFREQFGHYFFKWILWFKGMPNIGKSKLLSAIFHPMKEYVGATQGRPLNDRDMPLLAKMMITFMPEVQELESHHYPLLKTATGSAEIAYRYLYGEAVPDALRTSNVWCDSNKIDGLILDYGMINRMLVIPEPNTDLLFCTSITDSKNKERNPELYSVLESLDCFSDSWGMVWSNFKQGIFINELDLELRDFITSKNSREMYKPAFTEIVETFFDKDVTFEQALELNKKEKDNIKPYIIFQDARMIPFISSVVRSYNGQTSSQYVKKDDMELIRGTINRYRLGGHSGKVGGHDMSVFRVALINPFYSNTLE